MDKVRVGASNIGQEAINCIKTVRTFATEEEEVSRYAGKLRDRYHLDRDDDVIQPTMASLNEVWPLLGIYR